MGMRRRKVHLENKLRSPGKALDMMSIWFSCQGNRFTPSPPSHLPPSFPPLLPHREPFSMVWYIPCSLIPRQLPSTTNFLSLPLYLLLSDAKEKRRERRKKFHGFKELPSFTWKRERERMKSGEVRKAAAHSSKWPYFQMTIISHMVHTPSPFSSSNHLHIFSPFLLGHQLPQYPLFFDGKERF